jgi:phosphopantetheine--protein transferase-like protein
MEFGIGTDIENISRFNKLKEDENFLKKIFTDKEIKYCLSKSNPESHFAARYCGKEAVIKALNNINQITYDYKKIEILNNEKEVPFVNILDKKLENISIKISLSHNADKAIAFVFAIKKKSI